MLMINGIPSPDVKFWTGSRALEEPEERQTPFPNNGKGVCVYIKNRIGYCCGFRHRPTVTIRKTGLRAIGSPSGPLATN